MHGAVIGGVEGLAVEFVGQHGDLAVEFVADDAARGVLEADLAALVVEGVAVAVVGVVAHDGDVAVFRQVAQLGVVRDVAPDEVVAAAVPGGAFGPEHSGVQAADGGVPLNEFFKGRIECNDIGIGIALRRLAAPVAGEQGGGGGGNGEAGEEGAAVGIHERVRL